MPAILYPRNNIGVATAPLKSKDLSEQTIIDSIEEMHRTYDIMKQNVLSVSEKIKAENGTAEAVQLIEKVIDKYNNVNKPIDWVRQIPVCRIR